MDALRKTPPLVTNQHSYPTLVRPLVAPVRTMPPTTNRQRSSHKLLRVLFTVVFGALLLALTYGGFLLFKSVSLGERMQFENTPSHSFLASLKKLTGSFFTEERTSLRGEEDGRINILLLGRAGTSYPGKNLTDTVMLMSIDTTTKQVALLSLPRDLYVPIDTSGLYTKLNSLYQYGLAHDEGVEPLKETITAITGVPIHYFVTLDFDGFEKIVDTLGGISLDVVRDFYDPRYPGKNYSYETFEIKKGWQTLDGATALKYVRERHNDPDGDFGRAKRQQQVIQAIKNKTFALDTLFNAVTVSRLLDTLGDSVRTDMSIEDMGRFLEFTRTLDTTNVTTVVVDAWKQESLLRVAHVQVGSIAAFILVPRVSNFSELIDTTRTIFHRDEKEKRKQAIEKEAPTLTLFAKRADSDAASKIAALLTEEMGFAKVTLVWLPVVDNRREKSIIIKRERLTKPFSLDELLKKFALTQAATLPFTPDRPTDSDFAIVLGTDLTEAFSLSEADSEALDQTDDLTFPESLPPQPLKKLY